MQINMAPSALVGGVFFGSIWDAWEIEAVARAPDLAPQVSGYGTKGLISGTSNA